MIDIGGQDSKVIVCEENGAVADFIMSDKCAAGTEKLLEMMLEPLGETFATQDAAVTGVVPVQITSTCAVFAESEVIGLRASGANRADILAGIIASTAEKAAGLAARIRAADVVFLSGGLSACSAGPHCPEGTAESGPGVTSPDAQFAGAIGAALKGF
ncbi:MAG: hypothetical protein MJ014_06175 [Methanocorpusculum sp.]|nr:hypothetical protein [Methanocorpusculum sp.]